MPDYTGGYTGAIDAESRRNYVDTQTASLVNALAMLKRDDEENQRAIAEAKKAKVQGAAQLAGMLNQAPGGAGMPPGPPQGAPPPPAAPTASMAAMFGPQSPMPGQSSQPMQQPRPAPPGGAMPPGGPMPPPAPAAPMEPWKAMPGAPAAAPGQMLGNQIEPPKPQEAMEMIMRGKTIDPLDMFKTLTKQGARPEDALAQVEQMAPLLNAHNKGVLEDLRINMELDKKHREERALALREAAERRLEANTASQITRREVSAAQGERRVSLLERKAGAGKGGQPGVPGVAAQPKDDAEKRALEIQAWQYIEKGTLPYRKGTGGGKDKNDQVMREVARISKDFDLTPTEITAQPAEWKANAQSMAFQQKKVDAIQGQLNSFHNNLDTWDNLAKGIAPKIGGERVAAFSKDLQKINFLGVQSFDDVKLKIQQQIDDPSVAAYMVASMAAAMDYARIMQGPQSIASLTEGARHDAQRLVAAGADDKARRGIMAAMESDTQGQVKGLTDQLNKTKARMGMRGGSTAIEKAQGTPAASKVVDWSDLK